MIITGPLTAAAAITADEKWLITRVEARGEGIIWVPELAPSQRLFQRYMTEWRGRKPERYWSIYEERYMAELQTEEKKRKLRELWKRSADGQVIAALCYCQDPRFCHRRLVAEFLKAHGATVIEHIPQQATLF